MYFVTLLSYLAIATAMQLCFNYMSFSAAKLSKLFQFLFHFGPDLESGPHQFVQSLTS